MTTIATGTIIIAAASFLNYAILFVKSILIARYFGAASPLDAYFVSIIPLMIVSGVVSISLQVSFIPVYIEKVTTRGRGEAGDLCRTLYALTGFGFAFLAVVIATFPIRIVSLIAPGFTDENRLLAASLLYAASPAVLLSGLCEAVNGVFYAEKKFLVPSIGGLLNSGLALAYIILFNHQGVFALAYGTVVGYVAQFIFLMFRSRAAGYEICPKFHGWDPGIWKVLNLSLPIGLSSIFSSINASVDQIMASLLPSGAVSALSYASNIYMIIAQLFIFSIGTAILPFLSSQVSLGKDEDLASSYCIAVRMGVFLCVPVVVMILMFGTPIIRMLYERGLFGAEATTAVSGALKAFSPSLIFLAFGIPIVRILTAYQKTRIIAAIASICVLANIGLNFLLMQYLGHIGIALSTSITYMLSLLLLALTANKLLGFIRFLPLMKYCAMIISIAVLAVFPATFYYRFSGQREGLIVGSSLIGILIVCYIGISRLFRIRELRLIVEELKKIMN